MIRSKYIYALLTLVIVFYFAPANAQNKTTSKKAPAKTAAKKPAVKSKTKAKATAATDTTKKGGKANAKNPGAALSEEIIVTTAYKPVLADAVKIRRNPDLEDKTPFKAPLVYIPIDKRLELNTSIKPLEAMKRPAEQDTVPTNNYVKVGLGSLKTTYGEAYFANGRDNALQVGGYLKHFAQNGNLYKQNSAKEEAGVFGKSVGELNNLSGRITYNYNSNYF